ncbi:MAG: hypothetical protein QM765_10220 [Myxococcales bacterium]
MPRSWAAPSARAILREHRQGAGDREAAGPHQDGGEALAVERLHRVVEPALGRAPEVDHVDDVLLADLAGGHRLLLEAADQVFALRELGAQHLDGEVLAQDHVLGEVDRAHPAFADDPQHAVAVAQDLPEQAHVAQRRPVRRADGGAFGGLLPAGGADGHAPLP